MESEAGMPGQAKDEKPLPQTHTNLRESLLHEQVPPHDFLEELFELDQKNKNLPTYEANISLLEDPQIKSIIEKTNDPYLIHTLQDKLSFFRYHQAQQRAALGDVRAPTTFEQALEEKKKARAYLSEIAKNPALSDELRSYTASVLDENGGDTRFTLYIQANAAYMNKRTEEVSEIHDRLQAIAPDEPNTKIIGNLLNGLKSGAPDYKADHHP